VAHDLMRRPLAAAAAAAAAAALAFCGCASFPRPSSPLDSLFVLISENPAPRFGLERGPDTLRFSGPSPFQVTIGSEERRTYFFRVKAGRYALVEPAAFGVQQGSETSFDVPPGAVFLYPLKLTRVRTGAIGRTRTLVPMAPDDQKSASALLTDWFDYEKWLDREVIGFGAWPPRLVAQSGEVQLDISSTPAGAEAAVDDRPCGVTPVTVTVPVGRHVLRLEIPGVAVTRTAVDVQSKSEISVSLPIQPEPAARGREGTEVAILLGAFRNMGSADADNLASTFPQVIKSDLADHPRVRVVDGEVALSGVALGEVSQSGAAAGANAPGGDARTAGIPRPPDFDLAAQRGADLVVSGYYIARADGLLVYAALYDVQSRMSRTSIMYTGKAGLAMFDSIDAMAVEFIKGIDKVLPEVRLRKVQKGGKVQSQFVSYDRKRTLAAIVDKRQSRRSSLAFVIGPSFAAAGSVYQPDFPNRLLAFLPLGVVYDIGVSGPLSITAALQAAVAYGTASNAGVDYTSSPYLDIPLRIGPTYTVFGTNVDLSVGLQLEGRFTQAWFDTGSGSRVYKPILTASLSGQSSARLYLESRLSERPSFVYLGLSWFLIGGQMDATFTNLAIVPLVLTFNVGYGFRL
jgi:hypothetical protein